MAPSQQRPQYGSYSGLAPGLTQETFVRMFVALGTRGSSALRQIGRWITGAGGKDHFIGPDNPKQ